MDPLAERRGWRDVSITLRLPAQPVVGGALVYKDEHHMTTVFARTLWPYLARRVDRLVKGA